MKKEIIKQDKSGEMQTLPKPVVNFSSLSSTAEKPQWAEATAIEESPQAIKLALANMSHEMRTPLTAILSFTQLLAAESQLSTTQQEWLEIIDRNGKCLLQLVNDFLAVAKLEAGQVPLQENSFDLHTLLHDLETVFQVRAARKGVRFSCRSASNVPRYVQMDDRKLRQVLTNLLDNAVKFTQQGSVTLRVRNKSFCTIHFEIEDTGFGIASEELGSIFDAFVQTESGKQSQQGTGLGLCISKQIVQLLGGEISVSSCLGQGTIFRVDLPYKPVNEDFIMHSALRVMNG